MGNPAERRFELDASVREALSEERASVLLKELEEGVVTVKLGGKSFGDGSAEVAGAALARAARTLRHVDLADVIASRPEDEPKRALASMAAGLANAKHIISLDLSDNALGAKGIREVQGILSGQTALESLKLCNNGLAADAGELITQSLTEKTPTKLTLLHFHNNLLESAGAKALSPVVEASPDLEDFRFSGLRLYHDGAERICQALACVPENLRRINLSDNNFGIPGAAALADSLRKTRNVEDLILRDTALADEGMVLVAKALEEAGRRLRVLDVSGNEVTVGSAGALGKCVTGMPVLRVLMAEDNELGSAGAKVLANSLDPVIHADLQTIVLAASEIGTSGALALAKAAQQLPGLKSINLNANAIAPDAVEDIEALLDEKLGSLSDNDDECEDEEDEESEEGDVRDGDDLNADDSSEKTPAGDAGGDTVDNLAGALGSLTVEK